MLQLKSIYLFLVVFFLFTIFSTTIAWRRRDWVGNGDCEGTPYTTLIYSNYKPACQPDKGDSSKFFKITGKCKTRHILTFDTYSDSNCTTQTGSAYLEPPTGGCFNYGDTSYQIDCNSAQSISFNTVTLTILLTIMTIINFGLF